MQETATFREFAKIVAYSEAMVRKWVKKGVISKKSLDYDDPKRPSIIVELAKKDLAANQRKSINSDPEKRNNYKDKVGTPGKKKNYVPQIDPETGEAIFTQEQYDEGLTTVQMMSMSLTQLEKLKKIGEVEKSRIENQRKMKLLVPKEVVDKELFESAQILKSAFESIPSRVIDLIMAETDRDKAIILLEDEIDLAFNNMADAQDRLNNALENYE